MMLRVLIGAMLLLVSAACMAGGATNLVLKDLDGHVHDFRAMRGKWVLVNFWATWCPACRDEMPDLIALNNEHKGKDLVVIAVALHYSSERQVTDFVATQGIKFPVVLGDKKLVNEFGGVDGMPTSFLFAPNGDAVAYQPGQITQRDIDGFMKANAGKGNGKG